MNKHRDEPARKTGWGTDSRSEVAWGSWAGRGIGWRGGWVCPRRSLNLLIWLKQNSWQYTDVAEYPGSHREETQRGDILSFDSFREVEWRRKKARQERVCATDERDHFKNVPQTYTGFHGTWLWSPEYFKIIIHQWSRTGSPGIKPRHLWAPVICDKEGKNIQQRKDSLLRKQYWKTWQLHVKEWKTEHYLMPYRKINSKWFKDLNVRPDTIKRLMENRQNTLWHKSQQDLFWPTSYSNENKNKNKAMGPNLKAFVWQGKP